MSWSAYLVGTPANIVKALERQSVETKDPACKAEFDAALPHLIGLVGQNIADDTYPAPVLDFQAAGSAYRKGDKLGYSTCTVTIKPLSGRLV